MGGRYWYTLEYLPRADGDDVLPLIGGAAHDLLIVDTLEGFGNPRGRPVTTSGPAMVGARVREVLPEVPVEMHLAGDLVADSPAELDFLVRRYAATLDFMRGRRPASNWQPGLLRLRDGQGVLERRVTVREVDISRSRGRGVTARRIEVTFDAWDAAWVNPIVQRQPLGLGQTTFWVGGVWPVYPVIRLVAGPGGFAAPAILSLTHDERGLTFQSTAAYPQGAELVIDMDPEAEIAVVGDASQHGQIELGGRRFQLFPGLNTLTLTYTGVLASATVEWRELWPGA